MRILQLSNYYPEHLGGIEIVAYNLARCYRKAGHMVRWCAAETGRLPHSGHTDDRPLPAWNVTEDRLGFPYPIPRPWSYRALLHEARRCDAIHLHDCLYLANVFTSLAARTLRKPIILTQHVGLVPYRRRALRTLQQVAYRTLGRLVLTSADRVAFVSPQVERWFSGFVRFRTSTQVIPNGVDSELFTPADPVTRRTLRTELELPAEAPALLFVGRFVEKKGIHLLREVIGQNTRWSWVLIGAPGRDDPSGWGLPNLRVLSPASQQQLRRYYAAADLLVLPSVGEGFPVVVQEAMACGTPAVVSEEVARLDPAAQHLLFPTELDRDAIRLAIENALKRLHASPGLRDELVDFARLRWSWATTSRRYETILRLLVGNQASAEVAA